MTNAFAEMLASQMRVFLQNEGCPLHELEERFRRHLGMDLSTEQEASYQAALVEVTGQSRYLEELKPASILRPRAAACRSQIAHRGCPFADTEASSSRIHFTGLRVVRCPRSSEPSPRAAIARSAPVVGCGSRHRALQKATARVSRAACAAPLRSSDCEDVHWCRR